MRNASFRRKVVYLCAIAALLFPLYAISRPEIVDPRRPEQSEAGGRLAQLRREYNLSQAELGEIDPAGESIKLATLGLRGVAANLLWHRANQYKKTERWDELSATLNQITKLQPNFISVWEFQAHNLSFNVSVEFDNYEHRYHWVKKGISFLIDGTRKNRNTPRLLGNLGWFSGNKLGRSDERVQFRRMFPDDADFHDELRPHINMDEAAGPDRLRPDNWKVSWLWYRKAQRIVDTEGVPIKGKSPLLFHSDTPMALIHYSVAIEEDDKPGEIAQRAWQDAGRAWRNYGDRQIPTSWGHPIKLNDEEFQRSRAEQLAEQLDALLPGLREQMVAERFAELSEEERVALDTPLAERTNEQWVLAEQAEDKTSVEHFEVAAAAPAEKRERAEVLAREATDALLLARRIQQYRKQVNFEYWRTRCEVEQLSLAIEARAAVFDGNDLFAKADLEGARSAYETAWRKWAELYEKYPELADDVTAEDLMESINRYRLLLGQLDEPLPADFPLRQIIELHGAKYPPPPGAADFRVGDQPASGTSPTPESREPTEEPSSPEEPSTPEPNAPERRAEEESAPSEPEAAPEPGEAEEAAGAEKAGESQESAATPPAGD